MLLWHDGSRTRDLTFLCLHALKDGTNDPCQTFTGELAEEYCQAAGGHAVSLDSNEKVKAKIVVERSCREV